MTPHLACLKPAALAAALFSAGLLAACTSTATDTTASAPASTPKLRGQAIAEQYCSGCHAIGRSDKSTHPDSLPFRKISMHYPVRNLEEALGEGILVGHPDMPPFQFEPQQIDDLLSYIESIQDPA